MKLKKGKPIINESFWKHPNNEKEIIKKVIKIAEKDCIFREAAIEAARVWNGDESTEAWI